MSALDTLDKHPPERSAGPIAWHAASVVPPEGGEPNAATCMDGPLAGVAFNAERGRGKRLPSTIQSIAERDRLVRAMAARFFGGMSLLAQARQVHVELSRYASSAWTYERVVDELPSRHIGRAREYAWRILRVRDYVPSIRALRRTLANKHI